VQLEKLLKDQFVNSNFTGIFTGCVCIINTFMQLKRANFHMFILVLSTTAFLFYIRTSTKKKQKKKKKRERKMASDEEVFKSMLLILNGKILRVFKRFVRSSRTVSEKKKRDIYNLQITS
jgi:RsiW-degrading membrane proteinase PrsW (M82 family)